MSEEQRGGGGATTQAKGTANVALRRALIIALPVLVLFAGLAYLGYRWIAQDALATLTRVSGPTERDRARSMEQWTSAATGDDFHAGDGARTKPAAVAHFRLYNGAKLKLEPESQIRFQRPGAKSAVKVDVDVGRADVESGEDSVTIESGFGPIVLDPKSAITLSRDGATLNVAVDLGAIQIADRTLNAGSSIELEIGGLVVDPSATATATATAETAPAETAEPRPPELDVGDGVASADLVVAAGESFVVHDPNPPTAIGFRVGEVCDGPARVIAGDQRTEAVGQANLRFAAGRHGYEIRCLDDPDVVKVRGTARILHDAGTRNLPKFAPTANVVTDGRNYTVMYQHRLPQVTVNWPTAPQAEKYTLKIGSRTVETAFPYHTFPFLARGRHSVVFSARASPPRQSRTTTIDVVLDTQAPAARVVEGSPGAADSVTLSGQTMPGWNVAIGDEKIEVDGKQGFSVDVDGDSTVPIRFSHPDRDTHYYLRRPKASP